MEGWEIPCCNDVKSAGHASMVCRDVKAAPVSNLFHPFVVKRGAMPDTFTIVQSISSNMTPLPGVHPGLDHSSASDAVEVSAPDDDAALTGKSSAMALRALDSRSCRMKRIACLSGKESHSIASGGIPSLQVNW